MRYRIHAAIVSCLLTAGPAFCATTTLGGTIDRITFSPDGNPYIVENDIVIPAGQKVVVNKGCVFLFKPFTALIVRGQLFVDGTEKEPVVFTSINDDKFNPETEKLPAAFDWNGIDIAGSAAGTNLSHAVVSYSVFGVKSQYDGLVLTQCTFYENGQFNFTLHGRALPVVNRKPFTYPVPEERPVVTQSAPASASGRKQLTPAQRKKVVLHVVGATCAAAGLGMLGGSLYFNSTANDRFAEYQRNVGVGDRDAFDAAYADYEKYYEYTLLTGIGSGVFLAGAAVVYVFAFRNTTAAASAGYRPADKTLTLTFGLAF